MRTRCGFPSRIIQTGTMLTNWKFLSDADSHIVHRSGRTKSGKTHNLRESDVEKLFETLEAFVAAIDLQLKSRGGERGSWWEVFDSSPRPSPRLGEEREKNFLWDDFPELKLGAIIFRPVGASAWLRVKKFARGSRGSRLKYFAARRESRPTHQVYPCPSAVKHLAPRCSSPLCH